MTLQKQKKIGYTSQVIINLTPLQSPKSREKKGLSEIYDCLIRGGGFYRINRTDDDNIVVEVNLI